MPSIQFAGVNFGGLQRAQLLAAMEKNLVFMVTANAEIIVRANRDVRLGAILARAVNTLDGQIPFALARFLFPRVALEKISGSDFVYDACRYAQKNGKRVFLLGGYQASNHGAQEVLRSRFGIAVDGYAPPKCAYPFPSEIEESIAGAIAAFRPEILLVGFGAGKQEFWIESHLEFIRNCGVRLVMGCGGTFEFVSGNIPRAPRWVQRIGLEGLYRLVQEPRWFRVKRLLVSCKFFYDLVRKPRVYHAD